MTDKIELRLAEDSGQKKVELDNMSVEEASQFQLLIQNLVKIVQITTGGNGVTISVYKGSSAVAALGPQVDLVINTLENTIAGQIEDQDPKVTKAWNDIRDQIIKSNSQVEINLWRSGQKVNRLPELRATAAAAYVPKPQFIPKREFLSGELTTVGGAKTSNFHLQTSSGEVIIDCSKGQAQRAIDRLYKKIFIAAWSKESSRKTKSFDYIDAYGESESTYQHWKNTIEQFDKISSLEEQIAYVHDATLKLVQEEDINQLKHFMRLFRSHHVDKNLQHTILFITQHLKTNADVEVLWNELKQVLERPEI